MTNPTAIYNSIADADLGIGKKVKSTQALTGWNFNPFGTAQGDITEGAPNIYPLAPNYEATDHQVSPTGVSTASIINLPGAQSLSGTLGHGLIVLSISGDLTLTGNLTVPPLAFDEFWIADTDAGSIAANMVPALAPIASAMMFPLMRGGDGDDDGGSLHPSGGAGYGDGGGDPDRPTTGATGYKDYVDKFVGIMDKPSWFVGGRGFGGSATGLPAGSLVILCNGTVDLGGFTIFANGGTSTTQDSGGGGGSVYIAAQVAIINGTIDCKGGDSEFSGAGGGGLIRLQAPDITTITTDVAGGTNTGGTPAADGDAGLAILKDKNGASGNFVGQVVRGI